MIFGKGPRREIFQRDVELFSVGSPAKSCETRDGVGNLRTAQGLRGFFGCGQVATGLHIRSQTPPGVAARRRETMAKKKGTKKGKLKKARPLSHTKALLVKRVAE